DRRRSHAVGTPAGHRRRPRPPGASGAPSSPAAPAGADRPAADARPLACVALRAAVHVPPVAAALSAAPPRGGSDFARPDGSDFARPAAVPKRPVFRSFRRREAAARTERLSAPAVPHRAEAVPAAQLGATASLAPALAEMPALVERMPPAHSPAWFPSVL